MGNIRFIGIDLDGTLFDNKKEISAGNIEALGRAIEKGVIIIPITGRPLFAVTENVYKAFSFPYVVASGGAAVYDTATGECIRAALIDGETAESVIKGLKNEGFLVNVFLDGKGFVDRQDYERTYGMGSTPAIAEYFKKYRVPVPDILEVLKDNGGKAEKITSTVYRTGGMNEEETERLLRVMAPYRDKLEVMYGKAMTCEITSKEGTKGHVLRFFEKKLGIPLDEMMVIGDTYNDLDMIKTAGLGVAMGNAEKGIRDAADVVAPDNESDGVAYVIEKYVLN